MGSERKFTDLELERSLAGDLSPRRARDLERGATDADRQRLGELRAEHQALMAQLDIDAEVAAIHRRALRAAPARPTRFAWLRWMVSAGALAAAAAVLLIITRRSNAPSGEDDLRTKGDGVTLIVHVATGSESRPLHTGATVHPGARLRFEVNAARRGFVAVVGIDGTGEPTVYYPHDGRASAELDPRAGGLLPGAVALDATPGDERFYALYSAQPFVIDTVVPAIRAGAAIPGGVTSAEVMLHKEPN